MMKIINIGPVPPPYDGVSVHVMRLKRYLDINCCDNLLVNTARVVDRDERFYGMKSWQFNRRLKLRLFLKKKSILHFHNFSTRLLWSCFLYSFRHYVILSFHNERFVEELKSKGRIKYTVYIFLLNKLHCVIVDNRKCVAQAGQLIKKKDKIFLIPEFIRPSRIPDIKSASIINFRKSHKFLFSSNASSIAFYKNADLYGIDMLVEVLNSLYHNHGLDAAIAFLLPPIGDDPYIVKIRRQIEDYGLGNRILFITEPLEEGSSLWKISDIVIRATNTDGNSVTVLEALNMGIPVIASDCVERPKGSILFKTRDVHDLERIILEVIEKLEVYKNKNGRAGHDSNARKILSLYESFQD